MNKKLASVLLLSLCITSIVALQAIKAPDETVLADVLPSLNIKIYAYFEGIPGESEHIDYEDWIDVLTFEFSIHQPETTPGPIRRRGEVEFGDIVLTKMVDKATPKLMEKVALGEVIPDVKIVMTKGEGLVFYQYELSNVLVTGVESSVSTMGDIYPSDTITLGYEEIKVIYTQYDTEGHSMGNIEWEYTIESE
jgi:type VI secretion system secreted protein Hcp